MNNKLNPHVVFTPGFEPRPHWWEAIALTTCTILASHTTLAQTWKLNEDININT